MTLWLDANDVNGDGLSELASDFTTIGGQTHFSMGRPLKSNNSSFQESAINNQFTISLVE